MLIIFHTDDMSKDAIRELENNNLHWSINEAGEWCWEPAEGYHAADINMNVVAGVASWEGVKFTVDRFDR